MQSMKVFLLLTTLMISFTALGQQPDGGLWRMGEPRKDSMTDKAITTAVLGMKDTGVLYVGRNGDEDMIWVLLDSRLFIKDVAVQWRIDDLPMVEETWTVSNKIVGTMNNKALLRAMVSGTRLRIRITGLVPTMDFKIAGLGYYIPKLGMKLE